MEHNLIFFLQTVHKYNGIRHCYLVTAPSKLTAEKVVQAWMDDNDELIQNDLVERVVDTDSRRNGLAEIIMHN